MADIFKLPKLEPQPSGVLKQTLVGVVNVSAGAADAGKVVLLGPTGHIDSSMVTGSAGSSVSVNGSLVTNPNFKDSVSVTWSVAGSDVTATVVGSGTVFQVNALPVIPSTTINFEDGTGIHVTNLSAGNIQFTLSPPTPQTIGAVASEWLNSYNAITGVFTATEPAFGDISGTASKGQLPATTVYTDQANTFGAFLQKFQAGAEFDLVDPTDTTKVAQFDVSNIAGGATRTVNIPNASSTTVQPSTAPTHQFAISVSAQGVVGYAQPVYGDISGTPQLPVANSGTPHEFFTSYNSVTGVFGLGQPAFTDLSDYSTGTASPTLASVILKGATTGTVTVEAASSTSPPWTLTLPVNAGSPAYVLQTDGSGNTSWVATTIVAPGLPFNSIQFNNAGTFGGSSNFTYDGSTIVTLAGTMNANVFAVGTLGFVDTNIFESLQKSANSYVQAIIQNTNAGATASADVIVANNNTTASTFYGDFGINSSGWTGVGGSYNLPNAVYLSATSGDLVLGTTTANAIHFFVNGGATDAMLINGTTGAVTALVSLATPQVNVMGATSGVVTIQSLTGTWSLTLPANAGGAGNLLVTDGTGVTSWVSPGASTLPTRQTATTGALTIDANKITTTTIILAKKFALEKVVSITSPPCPVRVRLYSTAAAMNADTGTTYPAANVLSTSDRPNFIPPTPGTQHGVIADLYLDTSDKYNGWNMSPVAEGCNLDPSPSTSIYIAITNIDTVTRAQNVTLTYVAGEA